MSLPVPPGWRLTTLGEACAVVGGATPDSKEPGMWGGDISWVTPADLSGHQGMYVSGGARTLSKRGFDTSSTKMLPPGSVLFSSRAPIGHVAITIEPVCTNQGFKSLIPHADVSSEYLYWYMKWATPTIRAMASGTTFAEVSGKVVKSVPLLLPPLAEQQRIATHVTARLGALDSASADLRRLRRMVRALRLSIARGFLPTPSDVTARIGDLATVGSGATPLRSDPTFWAQGDIPWLTSGDLNARRISSARQFITERAVTHTAVRFWQPGTLLIAMYGEGQTRGRCSLLTFPATTNQACAGIFPNDNAPISVAFLQGYFEAAYHRNRKLAAGGVQPNLNLGLLKDMMVPVRPAAAQTRAVADYEEAMEQLTAATAALDVLNAKTTALHLSILNSAMTGQLPLSAAGDTSAVSRKNQGNIDAGDADARPAHWSTVIPRGYEDVATASTQEMT